MPRESLATVTKRRVTGLLYLVIVGALVLLSVAFYQKKFTPVVLVTLRTDHTGNALQAGSDVKERGIIVGSVRSVSVQSGPDGGCPTEQVACVKVQLALDPSRTAIIPNNVSAQILPKTIFGEQFVSLQLPSTNGPAIKAGDVIAQDRSRGALEAQKVLGDLLPLLQAVQPAQLNATLTALATALQGRGTALGQTLVQADQYLRSLNPYAGKFVDDLTKLGKVADEYNRVAPDLLSTLDNLQTTARTLIDERTQVSSLLTTATTTSNVVNSFLADNAQRLITVSGTSDTIYSMLASYSSEFPCLFGGMARLYHKVETVVQGHAFRLSVVVDQTNLGKYKPGEQPHLVTGYGPNCFGLPDNPQPQADGHFQIPPKYRCLNDGAALTGDPCAQDGAGASSASRRSSRTGTTATQSAAVSDPAAAIGSPAENALVNSLICGSYGNDPHAVPAIATILAAPLLRGQEVVVK